MAVFRDFPRTLLPIDRWAQIIGLDPRHFRQVTTTVNPPNTCAQVWKQYSWQEADQVGRFDVADAIQKAERTIAQYLGYKLLPTWELNERQRTPRPGTPELLRFGASDPRGFSLAVHADWGHFVEGGLQVRAVIEAAVAITYSDEDGDGYDETATIAVATTVTDEEEIAIFYPGEGGTDKWEIRPLNTVSIAGGVATITCWRHQLVDPDLIEALAPEAVVGATDANFLTTVDVYRRSNTPAGQLSLIWNPNNFFCNLCSTAATTTCCPVCGQTVQEGCLMPKDYGASLLMYRAATYDATDDEWTSAVFTCGRNPDQLLLSYRAGLEDKMQDWPKLQMDPQWERAVSYYALALLDRPICDCTPMNGLSAFWREDLARQTVNGSSFQLGDNVLDSPLGTTRAAVHVWNMIKEQGRRLAQPVRW